MGLKAEIPPEGVKECIAILNAALKQIMSVGNFTQVEYRMSPKYASIIIEVRSLIGELKEISR